MVGGLRLTKDQNLYDLAAALREEAKELHRQWAAEEGRRDGHRRSDRDNVLIQSKCLNSVTRAIERLPSVKAVES